MNLHVYISQARSEDLTMATQNDMLVGEAWVGHPYYELIDNSTDFETKMRKLTKAVTDKLGIPHAEEWLDDRSVKLKFLVSGTTVPQNFPVNYRDFTVHHDYLPCFEGGPQARIRRRGRHGKSSEEQDRVPNIYYIFRQVDVHPHCEEAGGWGGGGDQD